MKKNSVSIIIPTLNEEENIKPLVEEIAKNINGNYEIIFIDDHSTDKTAEEIKKLSKIYPIKFQLKKGKKGKTFSLIEGFASAKYDHIAMIDADLQYPPSAIPKMLEYLKKNEADIVASFRKEYKAPRRRKAVTKFNRLFVSFLWGLDSDTQSGLKVFKKIVLKEVEITTDDEWLFDIDFLSQAKNKGYRIKNYDIKFSKRSRGESKISYSIPGTIKIIKNGARLKLR